MAKLGLVQSRGSQWLSSTGATVLLLVVVTSLSYVTAERSWHCGRAADTVRSICGGCYAGGIHTQNLLKRSSVDRISLYTDPFLTKSNALNFLLPQSRTSSLIKRRGRRPGFIEECCEKKCEVHEMIFYCCAEKQRFYAARFPEVFRIGRVRT